MNEDLKPRDYQVELVDTALKKNGIIFMPTGSGKTYVASLLIRELAKGYLGKKLSQGGKRTFFLVNTVQLVTQQAYCVASQTPHSVGTYSGDMNVDYWSNEKWSAELDSHEVLVMTAQIFLNLVLHAVLKFSEVNLLIMDECHHARNNHAMAQIMNLYKDFPGEKPHILGLTATLLNANCKPHQIDTEIRDLENALCATIITPSDEKVVQKFSTNPIEVVVEYSPGTPGRLVILIESIHQQLISLTKSMKLPDRNLTPVEIIENAKLLNKKKTWDQHLSNMLRQTTDIYTILGLNAASKSILALIVRLERVKLHAEETSVIVLLNIFTTRLHYLRKCMEDEMRECPLGLRPVRFATPKLIELLSILKQMKPTDSILVFVELRFTAKVLHYVVEELSKNNESFSHVKCDFIVGNNNNPMNDVREMLFSTKVNQSTLKRFNTKITNVLFASDVIEEGTDIGHCNSVIKFDRMKSFRSYVQSKGRARHKESVYYVFAEDEKAKMTYNSYKYIEGKMTEILRKSIPDTHMGEFVSDPVEPFSPFGPDGPKVTVYSAISLINRYTSLLPQDKFAHLATFWWSRRNSLGETHAILQLPVNSAIKEPIEGPFCKNEVDAKRTAALVACKMLFEAGEFDDQLLPRGYDCDILHDMEIFALWPEREPMSNPKPGTNKRLQLYKVRYPSALFGCLPTPNTKLYLHAFKITPTFESYGNTRLEAFMDHLSSSHDYAMLSSKPFPKLCDFSLYMNIGEVVVSVLENIPTVQLTREEINLASNFQTFLFTEVLSLAKKFLVKDFENQENSYWVVPVITDLKKRSATIDWKTMKKHQSLPEIKPVPSDVREKQKIRGSDYIGKVVVPWYRPGGVPSMRYIVTKVCENLSPSSQFPSETYNTYSDYFQVRYGERVVNSDQPLIEVRAISSKINCIRPRIGYKSASKRKRLEDNFEETLIPELCVLLDFPGDYMLKATILPSLFHRVHHLLLADELRQKIVLETGLGKLKPPGNSWKKLEVDNTCLQDEEEPATQSTVGVSDLLTENMESLQPSTFPWRPEEEPVDIERQLNHVDLLSIIHFNKFVSSSKESFDDLQVRGDLRPVSPKVEATAPRLAILDVDEKSSYGPQLADMLPVITSMRAADIVNYERLETLGDSFLKFAISLMLFSYYPELNEGKLTQVKGKIVGNRNLYYCGHDLGLGEIIKARDFSPEDWLVPGFTIVSSLKSILVKNKISPHRFYNINLDKEEINSGLLSDESLSQVNEVLNTYLNTDDPEVPSKANNYTLAQLGLQPVADKCIADSVEALLGVYMQTCGLRGAFKLCSYLGVIPNKLADVTFLLDKPPPTALRKPGLPYGDLMKADVIETTLGYRFRDRSFLLQALTHSSSVHFATDCYQRLEFLGDAVLDFLITLYIFDACGKLSPGDLTDLRSALVNNITFSCLAVKYDFHKHLIARSFSLTDIIQSFADRQVKRGHSIGAEVSFLVEESDVSLAESVEVPKVLGDLFESIIGAVYLDSGKCLKTTWDVVYRLMHDVILSFSKNVPKNNIRLLYEKFPNPLPKFGKSRLVEDGRVLVPLEIIHNGPTELERKIFTGMGLTKAAAKLAAAKFALRHFHDKKVE